MRRQLWFFGVLVFAGAVLLVVFLRGPSGAQLPEFDLTGVHPRVAKAIGEASARVKRDPSSGDPWGNLGQLLMSHNQSRPALYCLERAAALEPHEFKWPYFLAYLLEQIDLEQAVRLYAQARELRPEYVPLRLRLARCLMRLDRLDEVDKELAEALREDDQNPHVWCALGRAALAKNDLVAARAHFEKAAALPNWYSRIAHVELVRVCNRLDDVDAALAAQQQVSRLPETARSEVPDPVLKDVESFDVLSHQFALQTDMLVARGKFVSAVNSYRTLIALRPDLAQPRINLAHALELQGNLPEAIRTYRDTIQQFPTEVNAYFGLALALEHSGNDDAAINAYRRCIELKPDYAQALFNLGLALQKQNDDAGAEEAFARAADAQPQFAPAHLALGVLLQQRGDLEGAITHMRAAVYLVPGDPFPQTYLERALQEKNCSETDARPPK